MTPRAFFRFPDRLRATFPALFFAAVALGTLPVIATTLFVPSPEAAPRVAALFGQEYAAVQLAAFDANPWLVRGHAVIGFLLVALAPFQFWTKFRNQNRSLHRRMGYALLACLALLSVSGLAVAIVYPFAGVLGMIPNAVWTGIILYAGARAFAAIRRRAVREHEAWMARAMAVTLGVTFASLYIPLLVNVLHLPSRMALGVSFWLGVGECLLVVELWIRRPRGTA